MRTESTPRHGILHGSPAATHWKDQLWGEALALACMAGEVEENGIDVTEISNIYQSGIGDVVSLGREGYSKNN